MHISILLMEQIIQLFLMIFMGFLIVKAKLLNSEDSKRTSYCPCWFCYDTGNSFDCCFYFGKSISFE